MRRERPVLLNRQMRLMLSETLSRDLHTAASKSVMSASEYARRAILERLRRDRRIEQQDRVA